ncbi:MAG TPA: hypothetical protein VHZ78_08550 [Rhizomicrobium sp.]|nr:hypothetical protein [Rhizomicrobium sp.]
MADLAEEEADAVPLVRDVEIPDDAELTDVASEYWDAWHLLTTDRPLLAMGGAGRIPWSSIERYAARNGVEDARLLARMLWAMDVVYLDWLADQVKRHAESAKKS